jgi:hypothetical protein
MNVVRSAAIAALLLTIISPAILAQQGPAGGARPAGPGGMAREATPEEFSETKARVLKMIEERKTRLDKEKACVEKAASHEDLRKCRSEHTQLPGGSIPGGPGQQRPPQTGGADLR